VSKKVKGAMNITKIARIIYPANLAKMHLTSAAQMKASLKFHGTRLVCDSVCTLGTPCLIPTCCICGVLRGGFKASFIRRGKETIRVFVPIFFLWPATMLEALIRFIFISFPLLGPGFYFAPDAATSTSYCVANAKGIKAMFLCSVYEPVVTKAISNHTNTRVVLPRFLICYR